MSGQPRYLLDADTFIRAKRQHYAPDFCPGFWDALLREYRRKRLGSIEPIRRELLRGNDALAEWVRDKPPEEFFEFVTDAAVQVAYATVITWVEGNSQFSRAAKQRFVSSADPWLIAVAIVKKCVVVTYEVAAPDSKALIKLPDVARHFKVTCIPPYAMLRQLNVVLSLK